MVVALVLHKPTGKRMPKGWEKNCIFMSYEILISIQKLSKTMNI